MLSSDIIQLTQQALWMVLYLAGPPVLAGALFGLLVSFIQAATQLQEQTVQFAVKLFAIMLTIVFTAALMATTLFQYTDRIFTEFPSMVSGG
jgi:type III secretion HrpO family protein